MSKRSNKPNKVGRNNPCPCGSGRKYKHCCLHSGEIQLVPSATISWEKESAAAAKAMARGMCCAPPSARHECVRKIVRAHTVPRSSLGRIAENGHVLSFRPDITNLKTHGTAIPPKPRGIHNASTFTGFCTKHDNDIFAPLEKAPFAAAPEQCFLLAYRALARELYLKTNTRLHYESRLPRLASQHGLDHPFVLGVASFAQGTADGERDLTSHKRDYDRALLASDHSGINSYVVELAAPPPVMCSGAFIPEHTFGGQPLEVFPSPTPTRQTEMTVSSFADTRGQGFVVFAWLDDPKGYAAQFVDSLSNIPDSHLTGPLLRFMFEYCENVHIRPSWWRSLSAPTQAALVAHMDMTSEFDPFATPRDFYSPDGVTYRHWPVTRRYLLRHG